MFVPQNRLAHVAVAGRTRALLGRILVDRKPRRIDPQLDEVPHGQVLFQYGVRNLELLSVLLVHLDTIDQLIVVGKRLQPKMPVWVVVHAITVA